MVFYIQDVIVDPNRQRQGIGTQLMDGIMSYVKNHASNNTIVGLMSTKGKEAFYEKYGFASRPNERLGAGMTIFWEG
jgi:GNAT superfamily N-acetyltransferase